MKLPYISYRFIQPPPILLRKFPNPKQVCSKCTADPRRRRSAAIWVGRHLGYGKATHRWRWTLTLPPALRRRPRCSFLPQLFRIEPQMANRMRLRYMESHPNNDQLLLIKLGLVNHHVKLLRLDYLINYAGKVVPDFVVQILFPGCEIGGRYGLLHIRISKSRENAA